MGQTTIIEVCNLYQTPDFVCKYMCSMIPTEAKTILEPTKGKGNILKHLKGYNVTAPTNFFELKKYDFDCIIMNPPFSTKSAFGLPPHLENIGMKIGYEILIRCMGMSDNIIALMPLTTLIDSDVRSRFIKNFGLKSITLLPRKTFDYANIKTCILQLQNGYRGETVFKLLDVLSTSKKLF